MSVDKPKPPKTVFPERLEPFDATSYDCPRCGSNTSSDYYGPCKNCIAELQAAQQNEATEAAEVAYEPKMNVTPNAVALKDD